MVASRNEWTPYQLLVKCCLFCCRLFVLQFGCFTPARLHQMLEGFTLAIHPDKNSAQKLSQKTEERESCQHRLNNTELAKTLRPLLEENKEVSS